MISNDKEIITWASKTSNFLSKFKMYYQIVTVDAYIQ